MGLGLDEYRGLKGGAPWGIPEGFLVLVALAEGRRTLWKLSVSGTCRQHPILDLWLARGIYVEGYRRHRGVYVLFHELLSRLQQGKHASHT